MPTLQHPLSGAPIEGVRISPNRLIRKDDYLSAPSGQWEPAGEHAGCIVPGGNHVIWVRQPAPLSDNALILLKCFARYNGGCGAIVKRDGVTYMVPKPKFNWHRNSDLACRVVKHPEYVEELGDHGYLAYSVTAISQCDADAAVYQPGELRRVWTLTDEGRQPANKPLECA